MKPTRHYSYYLLLLLLLFLLFIIIIIIIIIIPFQWYIVCWGQFCPSKIIGGRGGAPHHLRLLKPGETGEHCLSNISIWSLVTFSCQFRQLPNLHGENDKQAQNKQHLPADKQKCFRFESKTFLHADKQNVLAEHEIFEKFDRGETSKQGQAAETIYVRETMLVSFARPLFCKSV